MRLSCRVLIQGRIQTYGDSETGEIEDRAKESKVVTEVEGKPGTNVLKGLKRIQEATSGGLC